MGHRAGWLALGAGISGGADVILIPEIPYQLEIVADAIRKRVRSGKKFSIVAIAEGAMSREHADSVRAATASKQKAKDKSQKRDAIQGMAHLAAVHGNHAQQLAVQLEELTGLEARVTILGHLQRGGTPSAADRILATRLGSACVDLINKGKYGVLVAARGDCVKPVPLEEVAGKRKLVPLDHAWIATARHVGVNLGDEFSRE